MKEVGSSLYIDQRTILHPSGKTWGELVRHVIRDKNTTGSRTTVREHDLYKDMI